MDNAKEMEVLHSYSRAEAISDGVLIDISETADEAGFRYPMAVTYAAWAACVEVPEGCEGEQDEAGRLWDVMNMLRCTIQLEGGKNPTYFITLVKNSPTSRNEVMLKAFCGPGDNHEPVLTVMLPDED